MTREIIGANLRRIMKYKKISQKKAAKLAGLSEVTLSRAVRGKQALQPTNLKRLMDVLGITINDLITPEALPETSAGVAGQSDTYFRAIDDYIDYLKKRVADLERELAKRQSKLK